MADPVAQQILDLTRVVSDADAAQPGKLVHVNVLPGFSPVLPTTTTILSVAQVVTGFQDTLVNPITFSVEFDVKIIDEQGNETEAKKGPGQDFIATPDIGLLDNNNNRLPDPLNVAFLFKPPIGEDTVATPPIHYVELTGPQGIPATINVPVDVPALQIPALLLLGKHSEFKVYDGDDAGSLFVMVRASSPLRDLGTVVATLNRVTGIAKTLKSLLDFGSLFIDALGDAASIIGLAPTVYFSVGNASDVDTDAIDFEGVASSLLLIGVHDGSTVPQPDGGGNVPTVKGVTQVTLYNDEGFDKGGIDEEHTTFSVEEQIIAGVHTGLGLLRVDSFSNMDWATDPGDGMNDAMSSVRWGGVP